MKSFLNGFHLVSFFLRHGHELFFPSNCMFLKFESRAFLRFQTSNTIHKDLIRLCSGARCVVFQFYNVFYNVMILLMAFSKPLRQITAQVFVSIDYLVSFSLHCAYSVS